MTRAQVGDVALFHRADGGDIEVIDGITSMSSGLETSVYLSLFGGNLDDDGRPGNARTWWGNLSEDDPANQYRSETQHLIQALPSIPINLLAIEEAAGRDLAWMIPAGAASAVAVVASLVGPKRIAIVVTITADGEDTALEFLANWQAEL